ncbi:MAG: hypothetical protein WC211_01310 [Dehalococcoidia bacterium]
MSAVERLDAVRQRLVEARARRTALTEQRDAAAAAAEAAEAEVRAADVATAQLHAVQDITSARVQQTIADLCSEGLRIVFDDPTVRLDVRTVERRGVLEVDLVLVRGAVETDPLEGNGGGLVADAAAMLRMVLVRLLSQRGLAPLLVLDEPFAALSQGNRAAMAETLEQVADSLGIQVLVITHSDEFARGHVYRVRWGDRAALRAVVERDDDA